MIKVKKDPVLSKLVPMEVPNRFELLSLLIDSPINQDQERLIFEKLNALEKGGIRMLEKMSKPMDKEAIQNTLAQACAGQLHYLTDAQRKAVNNTHYWCMIQVRGDCPQSMLPQTHWTQCHKDTLLTSLQQHGQACLIGTICTMIPGMFENLLVMYYETDGESCVDRSRCISADFDMRTGIFLNRGYRYLLDVCRYLRRSAVSRACQYVAGHTV